MTKRELCLVLYRGMTTKTPHFRDKPQHTMEDNHAPLHRSLQLAHGIRAYKHHRAQTSPAMRPRTPEESTDCTPPVTGAFLSTAHCLGARGSACRPYRIAWTVFCTPWCAVFCRDFGGFWLSSPLSFSAVWHTRRKICVSTNFPTG